MNAKPRRGARGEPGYAELTAELRTGRRRPVYVLEGEDAHRMEGAVRFLCETSLAPAVRTFNYHAYAGEDADLRDVLRQALSFPMLAERQVLWLRDCDRCQLGEGREAGLERYLREPAAQTILVLSATKLDGRRRWVKSAREGGGHFVFANPDGQSLVEWVVKTAHRAGVELDEELAQMVCDRVGGDLRALSMEIEKLALAAGALGRGLTRDDIREHVRQRRESDVFELVNALSGCRVGPVLRVWRRLADDGHAAQELIPLLSWRVRQLAMVAALTAEGVPDAQIMKQTSLWPSALAQLRAVVRDLGEGGVARALVACRRCESTLKGSPLRPEIALERALLEICGTED